MNLEEYKTQALELYARAHIVLTQDEIDRMEFVELGLGEFERTGLIIVTYVNTNLCCAKEMVLLPGQTCPEHRHAPLQEIGYAGKEETFRCRYGTVYLYVPGEETPDRKAVPPAGSEAYYTAGHEIVLHPGEQYTIYPGTLHWFQSGPEGAVISEFSTASHDEYDLFTDPRIVRVPEEGSEC